MKMLGRIAVLLCFVRCVLSGEEEVMCDRNRTLLESSGDAVLTVFVDLNYGPACNVSSPKGFQEVSTALYAVQTLNKQDYVPGVLLGLKIFDTCHDKMTVYKQALMAAVERDCAPYYELGLLAPREYFPVLELFRENHILSVATYEEHNFTKPLLNVMVNFLSTRFDTVDLFLAASEFVLAHFLDASRDGGICVKSYTVIDESDNDTEIVIALAGGKDDIRSWIEDEDEVKGSRTTWIVLPLDGSHVDDLVPEGSYVIKAEPFAFDALQEFSSVDNVLRATEPSVVYSPHLLGIGRAIVEIAQVLRDLQSRSCPRGATCVPLDFDAKSRRAIRAAEVYEALRLPRKIRAVNYIVAKSVDRDEFLEVAGYRVDAIKGRVTPTTNGAPKMPKLCLANYSRNCRKCANFQGRSDSWGKSSERSVLKSSVLVPIYLTIVACGTVACLVIVVFIVYRYFAEEVLDGNPCLTVVLILSTIFMLQTVFPFCLDDDVVGSEYLNSRKIFGSTLSFGLAFSTMLSRALFLAFSTGGVFAAHINGYLQGLMAFFMAGVQVTISTMFFLLNGEDSTTSLRSLTFIALLGYDIFLLIKLFVVCCFIAQIQRNYREGKCFFGTVIGLLMVWAVWVTCFVLVEPRTRDVVVCSGTIATAYLIIVGVLVPRTYYMVTYLAREKEFVPRFDTGDFGADPRVYTTARQSRHPFYDYTYPMGGATTAGLHPTRHPNYYGNSSPYSRYRSCSRSPDPRRTPGYNNYGFNSEMREVENAYVTPRVRVENSQGRRSPTGTDNTDGRQQARHLRRPRIVFEEKDCIETDVYVEGRLSPNPKGPNENYPSRCSSPRLGHLEATIREEDEEEDVSRITRF